MSEVCDVRGYVRDATDSLVQLVCDLMGVGECARHEVSDRAIVDVLENMMREKEDEEIISRKVATLNTQEDSDEEEEEEEKLSRKRKSCKNKTAPNSPPATNSTSPTSSPSKRPRMRGRTMSGPVGRGELDVCLKLLETKKKGARTNGLRQYVLWREAYRAEKDRRMLLTHLEQVEFEQEQEHRRLSFH